MIDLSGMRVTVKTVSCKHTKGKERRLLTSTPFGLFLKSGCR